MLILAFDPGPTKTGYALAEGGGARLRFLNGGALRSDLTSVEGQFNQALQAGSGPVMVAIEKPHGFVYEPFRAPTLLETAGVAKAIEWFAVWRGMRVRTISASQVRKIILGKVRTKNTDRDIKAALANMVSGLPARTNVHVRDALAVAVAANWITLDAKGRRR